MAESYGYGDYDYGGEYEVGTWGEGEYTGTEYEGGYYDENGEWVQYDLVETAKQTVLTDIGEITYDIVKRDGIELYVDSEGRILNFDKLQAVVCTDILAYETNTPCFK